MRCSKWFLLFFAVFSFALLKAAFIEGYVRDLQDGAALSGASVFLKHGGEGSVSDKNGYFRLETTKIDQDTLVVKMIGYKQLTYPVDPLMKKLIVLQMETEVLTYDHNIVVTATRRPISVYNSSVSLSVIDKKEIERSGAQNIAEILSGTVSLQIRDYGGTGNMKTLSLRGTSAGHVLVMVDGQRINNPQNGEVDLALIPLNHVERIEILRGGASAIYGSDAIGGVVQIITKEAKGREKSGFDIKQSFASFGTYALEGGLSASSNNMGIIARYHYLSSKSDFSYRDDLETLQTRMNNDIKRHSFFTAFNYSPSNRPNALKVGVKYQYIGSKRGAPGTLSFPNPYARMFDDQHDIGLTLSQKTTDQKHRMNARIFYSNDLNRYLNEHPTDVPFPSDDRYRTEAAGIELQMSSVLLPRFILNYGLSIREDIFANLGIDRQYDRFNYAAYLVSENMFLFPSLIIPKIKITPSIRYNGNNEFKDTWTPKLGMMANLGPSAAVTLKSNYAFNYRVPTFNDLYWPADAYTSGNPDLLPEYGRDWDLGLRYHHDHVDLSVTFFHQDLTNLIIWESLDWIWTPQNIAKSRIRGLENRFEADIVANFLKIRANYTYMDARDLTNGTENARFLPNRARHQANIGLIGTHKNIEIRYALQYVGKRYSDAANTENTALASYLLNDISLGYMLFKGGFKLKGLLEIKNLFNVSYRILQDLPMPGREFRFTLSTELNK